MPNEDKNAMIPACCNTTDALEQGRRNSRVRRTTGAERRLTVTPPLEHEIFPFNIGTADANDSSTSIVIDRDDRDEGIASNPFAINNSYHYFGWPYYSSSFPSIITGDQHLQMSHDRTHHRRDVLLKVLDDVLDILSSFSNDDDDIQENVED